MPRNRWNTIQHKTRVFYRSCKTSYLVFYIGNPYIVGIQHEAYKSPRTSRFVPWIASIKSRWRFTKPELQCIPRCHWCLKPHARNIRLLWHWTILEQRTVPLRSFLRIYIAEVWNIVWESVLRLRCALVFICIYVILNCQSVKIRWHPSQVSCKCSKDANALEFSAFRIAWNLKRLQIDFLEHQATALWKVNWSFTRILPFQVGLRRFKIDTKWPPHTGILR